MRHPSLSTPFRQARCLAAALAFAFAAVPAAAEMREMAVDFYPHDDAGQGHPVRLLLEADFVPGGRPLEHLAEPPPAGSVERFLADYVGALRGDTVEAALTFWLESERDEARSTLEPVFERQRALFAQVEQSRLHAQVRYGRYLLAAVRHERRGADALVAVYPLVESAGGWTLSNALQADSMFQLLVLKFHEGQGLDRPFEAVPRAP